MDLIIREMNEKDVHEVIELIINTTLKFRKTDFNEEGWNSIVTRNNEDNFIKRLKDTSYKYFIAEDNYKKIVGVISIKDFKTIYQLFVLKQYWKLGIARRLWEYVKKKYNKELINNTIIVKSSNYAVPIYRKFGFTMVENNKFENGCRFTIMECNL